MSQLVYNIIKKQNGEAFARAIRKYDDGIFEIPKLPELVKFAGREAEPLLDYLENLKTPESSPFFVDKNPFQLLEEAGYDAFYVDSLEKQNSIEHYFAPNEALCTFNDPDRFKKYHIIHAIKKDVNRIKREDFSLPERHDKYGTSVISIQILKMGSFIKITNRYNHAVSYPDNTFNSNPDNIIKGLSQSLKNYFHVDFDAKGVVLGSGFVFNGNQILKIHTEKENTFFGEDFYLKDGVVFHLNKDYELLLDTVVVNLKTKEVRSPLNEVSSFQIALQEEIKDKKLSIQKGEGFKSLLADGREIVRFSKGYVTGFYAYKVKEVGNCFFNCHEYIKEVKLFEAKKIGMDSFVYTPIETLEIKNVTEILAGSLSSLPRLKKLDLPNLKFLHGFTLCYLGVDNLSFPKLKHIYGPSIINCDFLKQVDFPCLIRANQIVGNNLVLKRVNAPKLERIDGFSFYNCPEIEEIDFEKLKVISSGFAGLKSVQKINMPLLERVEENKPSFRDLNVQELEFPSLKKAGNGFIVQNPCLKKVSLPKLEEAGIEFLSENPFLEEVDAPNLKKLKFASFKKSRKIKILKADSLEKVSRYVDFESIIQLKKLYAPHLNLEALSLLMMGFEKMYQNGLVFKEEFSSIKEVVKNRFSLENQVNLPQLIARKQCFAFPCFQKTNGM